MWAIIGGSGFEKFSGFQTLEVLDRETPFGLASSGLKRVSLGEHQCLFISRHGDHHELLPSEVNYRANIFALKRAGARAILSFSAVGSLRSELKPGDLVVPTQYLDRTKGVRASTFCGSGVVGHVSLAHPVCELMVAELKKICEGESFDRHFSKTYVCIEGPYFSTLAESEHYRALGADIIGMTNFPEYALAREAGLSYLPCCFVTDYDCWDTSRPHVTLEEVMTIMRQNNSKAFRIAQTVVSLPHPLWADCRCSQEGLRTGLMSPREQAPKWMDVLLD